MSVESPTTGVNLDSIPSEIITRMPKSLAVKYTAIPLRQTNGKLTLLMADPDDLDALDDLKRLLSLQIEPLPGDANAIKQAIRKYYDSTQALPTPAISMVSDDRPEGVVDASVREYVDALFVRAVQERASDIHIEVFREGCRVRFRIDGILYDVETPPDEMAGQIVSAVKVMADLNIAERRLPQDGRITTHIAGKAMDLRISVIPMAHGEGVVVRILDKDSVLLGLDQLGFPSDTLIPFQRMVSRSHGLVLVTGPTGSGKTTTLYAALNKLNRPEVKIVTIEDPIEYEMRGVNQIQIKPKIGLTFASALRSVLRHDPDIILVGEVRDPETAEIAIQAALTGHLVFTTLHTESAAGAVGRLLEMGVESYLLASATIGILAQRLVRNICPKCKIPTHPDIGDIERLSQWLPTGKPSVFYKGKGCANCKHIGYRGRTAIFELFLIDEEARSLITSKVPTCDLAVFSRSKGCRSLLQDGFIRVHEGATTAEEVLRVCGE